MEPFCSRKRDQVYTSLNKFDYIDPNSVKRFHVSTHIRSPFVQVMLFFWNWNISSDLKCPLFSIFVSCCLNFYYRRLLFWIIFITTTDGSKIVLGELDKVSLWKKVPYVLLLYSCLEYASFYAVFGFVKPACTCKTIMVIYGDPS